MKLYKSLNEVPALRYYYFNFYYSLFIKTSPVKSGGVINQILELRKLVEIKSDYEKIVFKTDEVLSFLFSQKSGEDLAYCAFACLLKDVEITDLTDEAALQSLVINHLEIGYNELIGDIDNAFNVFNKGTDNGSLANYAMLRGNVLNADIDSLFSVLNSVEENILKMRDIPIYHPEHPKNAKDTFIKAITDLYLQLGYTSANDLKNVTAFEFLRKIEIKSK